MGKEARARGTFEERKALAIKRGRRGLRADGMLYSCYSEHRTIPIFTDKVAPEIIDKTPIILPMMNNTALAIKGVFKPIKQPGENRKEHKQLSSINE